MGRVRGVSGWKITRRNLIRYSVCVRGGVYSHYTRLSRPRTRPHWEEGSKEPDWSLVKEGVFVRGEGDHLCSTGQRPSEGPSELSTDTWKQQVRYVGMCWKPGKDLKPGSGTLRPENPLLGWRKTKWACHLENSMIEEKRDQQSIMAEPMSVCSYIKFKWQNSTRMNL